MLSKVLTKATCAECKFCCTFRRCSLWETPKFSAKVLDEYSKDYKFINYGDYGRMMLGDGYKTDDPEEEVPCYFLDPNTGCVLSDDDKPFECKIWPLRVMKKDGELVIALAKGCPSISEIGIEKMQRLVKTDLYEIINKKVNENPFIVEKYRDNYDVLCTLGKEQSYYAKVFSMHASVFNDTGLYDEAYNSLSNYRKEKVDCLKQAADKRMAVAAGVLLGKALASIGITKEPEIYFNDRGKPYFKDYPELFFNISHSHGIVVIALSNTEVGCDTEAVGLAKQAVADRFFTEEEKEYLHSLSEKDEAAEFFKMWTAKESVMKLTGLGMKLPLDSFNVDLSLKRPRVTWQNEEILPKALYLYDCPVKEDYVCTLASHVTFANIELISYNIKDDELKGFSL